MIDLSSFAPFYQVVICIAVLTDVLLLAILITLWIILFGKGFK